MTAKVLLCATWLGALAMPAAHASIVSMTFSGTVATGFDTSGVFGAANTSLVGDDFSITYVADDTEVPIEYFDPAYQELDGTNVPYTIDVTMNGQTVVFTGGGTFQMLTSGPPSAGGSNEIYASVFDTGAANLNAQSFVYNWGATWMPSDSLYQSIAYVPTDADTTNNGMAASGSDGTFYFYGDMTSASLNAVPEPGGGLLMAAGLATLAGARLRRRMPRRAARQRSW